MFLVKPLVNSRLSVVIFLEESKVMCRFSVVGWGKGLAPPKPTLFKG